MPDLFRQCDRVAGNAVIVLTRRPDTPNAGAWYVDSECTVLASLEAAPRPTEPAEFAWRGSSTGVVYLTKPLLSEYRSGRTPDLYSSILPKLIGHRSLKAYDNGIRYFLDFGTPADLARIDHSQVSSWIPTLVDGQWPAG
jgi:NDP-sugar pyrophosphorylase family protein